MDTYIIEIDEHQRLALIELFSKVSVSISEDHPLDFWEEMLKDLPDYHKEDPKAIQSFCF